MVGGRNPLRCRTRPLACSIFPAGETEKDCRVGCSTAFSYPLIIMTNHKTVFVLLLALCLGFGSRGVLAQQAGEEKDVLVLGGSLTEIVYALEQEDRIVGVDVSSGYPPAARSLPQVGYFRQISSEGIISLGPKIVLASEGAGPPESLEQIRATGIKVYVIESTASVDGARSKIKQVASVLGVEERGKQLIEELDQQVEEALNRTRSSRKPRVMFIYARGAGTVSVAGQETSADVLIDLAGGENVVDAYKQYRPITAESVVVAAPDVIVMLDRGLQSIGGVDGLLELPGIALTPAGQNRRIVSMDDNLFLNFGPRLGLAISELNLLLYDEVEEVGGR